MNRNHDSVIKIAPLILAHASSTSPTYGTTASAVSRHVDIKGWHEATFVLSVKEWATTTFASLAVKLQESNDLSTWADINQDESTNVARFFETESTAGTLYITGGVSGGSTFPGATYYMTMLVQCRERYIRAVPTEVGQAVPYSVHCILHEAINDSLVQAPSGNRIYGGDGGITV
jgi:hypothetical protein